MKQFLSLNDIPNFDRFIKESVELKKNPYDFENLGKRKTLGLCFFNASLRTRLSIQKAAQNLGLSVVILNFTNDAWQLEFENHTVMNGSKAEHIVEAAQVISEYCDILAIRCFAELQNREIDESEQVLTQFVANCSIPVVNMESATNHPLQALADALTIYEHKPIHKPKVVLTWTPHPKALPHAVPNAFILMMKHLEADFTITHPDAYGLNPNITKNVKIESDQAKALENADFVYAKNWSSYSQYGKVLTTDDSWMITPKKMELTNEAKFMHCLPVRRNVVVSEEVLESENSIVMEQVKNRIYVTQNVLKNILLNGKS